MHVVKLASQRERQYCTKPPSSRSVHRTGPRRRVAIEWPVPFVTLAGLPANLGSGLRVGFTSFRKLQTSLPPAFASATIVDPTFRMAATPRAQCSSNRNVPRAPSQLREDPLCRLLQHVLRPFALQRGDLPSPPN